MKNSKSDNSICKNNIPAKATGIVVPLGALFTKESNVIGEFTILPEFAAFCKKADLKIIQLLPVNDTGTQSSPYSGLSAFALHPIYINIKALPEFERLYESDSNFKNEYDEMVKKFSYKTSNRYNYKGISDYKISLLRKIYETTEIFNSASPSDELENWIKKNNWITEYAVYKNLKHKYMQASWKEWKKKDQLLSQKEIKKRWEDKELKKEHLFYAWIQMNAALQFKSAADKIKKAGIILKGDMPILMNEDSCDAWAHPDVFNHNLRAGSPCDGENPTGQNWGFPTYNWNYLKENKYKWWIDRLKSAEQYYKAYRLDHILGFFRIWAIPERDTTAVLGRAEPNIPITKEQFYNSGFDDGRIRWLSQPHVRTGLIQDITWNYESACSILGLFMNKIGNEELWLFKDTVLGDKDIYEADLSDFCSEYTSKRVKDVLAACWRDRVFIEIEKDKYVPVWTYSNSSAWKSLNGDEQYRLRNLVENAAREQDRLWEVQSDEILSALTGAVKMIPCGEDLGADLPCLPSIMDKNGILALRVLRWCRKWNENPVQPYIPLEQLPVLSVSTSSVHDSSTLRQWWDEDKCDSSLFVRTNSWAFENKNDSVSFSSKTAEDYLKTAAKSASVWCIHPIQDYLYMEESYMLPNSNDERINIPGSVSEFNWTYRIPVPLEEISKDKKLIEKIKNISALHDGGNQ